MRIAFLAITTFCAALCCSSGVSQVTPHPPAEVSTKAKAESKTAVGTFAERYPRYRLRPGDIFDVMFQYTPEFNQTVAVQPDGFVALRDAGELYVSGRTVPEVTNAIRSSYAKTLKNPAISVVLKDFEKPYFVADGEVKTPGKYEMRGDTTLTQAIAIAGGFRESAKHSQVLLFRRVSDEWVEAKVFNVKKMHNNGNLSEDVHLHPGDMLFVPKNTVSKLQEFLPTSSLNLFAHRF